MEQQIEEIFADFDGKLVGTKRMQYLVCRVLVKMPESVIALITQTTWFVSSMEDAWAFTFTGNDLSNQHLIFLSDELFLQAKEQIYYTIAHEIGHVVLGHRNSTLIRQSKEEIKVQEKEADEFAKRFI